MAVNSHSCGYSNQPLAAGEKERKRKREKGRGTARKTVSEREQRWLAGQPATGIGEKAEEEEEEEEEEQEEEGEVENEALGGGRQWPGAMEKKKKKNRRRRRMRRRSRRAWARDGGQHWCRRRGLSSLALACVAWLLAELGTHWFLVSPSLHMGGGCPRPRCGGSGLPQKASQLLGSLARPWVRSEERRRRRRRRKKKKKKKKRKENHLPVPWDILEKEEVTVIGGLVVGGGIQQLRGAAAAQLKKGE